MLVDGFYQAIQKSFLEDFLPLMQFDIVLPCSETVKKHLELSLWLVSSVCGKLLIWFVICDSQEKRFVGRFCRSHRLFLWCTHVDIYRGIVHFYCWRCLLWHLIFVERHVIVHQLLHVLALTLLRFRDLVRVDIRYLRSLRHLPAC